MNTWRTIAAALAVMLSSTTAPAVTVSGKVLDRDTGESIPGVTVQVIGTGRGAAADVEGLFSIPDLAPGPMSLGFSSLGYKGVRKDLVLTEGKNEHLIVRLAPDAVQLREVNVEADAPGEREYTPQVAQYKLATHDLSKLPQMVEPDLFRSLQIMPGVLPTSDFSSDLNIWGGSSDQNLVLLNGIEVYKPVHMGGLFSAFNMDAIKDVKLIKGGFGAKYGERLSAVLDIADREGNRHRTHGKAGLSLLSSNATLEGPLPRGSWLVAGRRTYLDLATKLLKNNGVLDYDFPYYFYDLNAKVTRDFRNGDRLSPSAYWGRDVLTLESTTHDQIRLKWGNATYSLPFVHVWTHKLFSTSTVAGSFYDSDYRFTSSNNSFSFRNGIRDFTVKTDFSWFADYRHTFDFGATAKNLRISWYVGGKEQSEFAWIDRVFQGWQIAAYLSDDFRLTDRWTITPGLRFEHAHLARVSDLLPRLAVKWQPTENRSLSAAWGLYSQYLQLVTIGNNFASIFDSYVPLDQTLRPNRGQQIALSFEQKLSGPMTFTADLYYKRFQHLIDFRKEVTDNRDVDPRSRPLSELFNEGTGYALGCDVFLQGEWPPYTSFMVGYALGRSMRKDGYYGPEVFPAAFDRLHNANLFLSRKFGKRRSLELRFNVSSGQPITIATAAYSPGFDWPAQGFVPGRKNNHRVPTYQRLDVAYRLRYERKHVTWSPYIEIINVYNAKNVLTWDYDLKYNPPKRSEVYQLPFIPSIGLNVEF